MKNAPDNPNRSFFAKSDIICRRIFTALEEEFARKILDKLKLRSSKIL